MNKTTLIILAVVAAIGIAAFILLSKKKVGGSTVAVAPPVMVPKQTNLASSIASAAPNIIDSISKAYATYEEYKD